MMRPFDVARLTRISRIRCRPALFTRPRSTISDYPPKQEKAAYREEEQELESSVSAFARNRQENADYEQAKRMQAERKNRGPSSMDQYREASSSSRRTLPSLRNRHSFRRSSSSPVGQAGSSAATPSNSDQVFESSTTPAGANTIQDHGYASVGSVQHAVSRPEETLEDDSILAGSSKASSSRSSTLSSTPSTPSTSQSSSAGSSDPSPSSSWKGKAKATEADLRRNPAGVQLLSHSLHKQLFPGRPLRQPPQTLIDLSTDHLAANGLYATGAATLNEINFDLPPLRGSNIRDHFHAMGRQEAEPYLSMAHKFSITDLPAMPENWATECPGWVKYLPDGSFEPIQDLGDEEIVSFDVEVLYKLSPYPVIATAATPNAWYSWLCPTLFDESPSTPTEPKPRWDKSVTKAFPHDLIPLFEGGKERLVIGHNVGYDRARIKDEYSLANTSTRFLDTLSLHVATRGITSVQRPAWMKFKKDKRETKLEEQTYRQGTLEVLKELHPEWLDIITAQDEEALLDGSKESPFDMTGDSMDDGNVAGTRWEDFTSVNSLKEVAALHCGHSVDKSVRDTFGDETITHASQLRPELQELIQYCADDVKITHDVFKKVFPLFIESCPHPASFAGMLNMGSAILPVDEKWGEYVKNAEAIYRQMQDDVAKSLRSLAEKLRLEGPTPGDPWHEQLDWREKKARWSDEGENAPLAAKEARAAAVALVGQAKSLATAPPTTSASTTTDVLETINEAKAAVASNDASASDNWWDRLIDAVMPNTESLSPMFKRKIMPLLLQLTYKGYPVVHLDEHAWCFRVPTTDDVSDLISEHGQPVLAGEADPEGVRAWNEDYHFFRAVGEGSRKKSGLLGKVDSRLLKKNILASPHEVALEAAIQGDDSKVLVELPDIEAKLKNASPTNPYVIQLQEVFSNKVLKRAVESSSSTKETWPAWYHDLTKPESQLPPGELDLSQKKSVTPLLLGLQWEGYPLVLSKNFKWCYRVPTADIEGRASTKGGVIAGLGAPVNWGKSAKAGDEHLQEDRDHLYFRLPHSAGEGKNVGNPLAKGFVKYLESGRLSAAQRDADGVTSAVAATATKMSVLCAYWISARERIMEQMVVYDTPSLGFILPQVITMGTVTRRAVEATWLTASNAKKNRVGSELKAMVRAPPGYALVGADVDSEELWISSVMGDSQFGMHGATAIGWMTLEGTKSAGTDLHSKTASILGTSRDAAKVFNYSRIYGAGVNHAVQLLMQGDGTLTKEAATEKARALYAATKGEKSVRNRQLSPAAAPSLWHGGSESFLFNTLEAIALSDRPTTPALGCGVTKALSRSYLEAINEYLPSRINWVVQSSGVDYLHLLIVSMSYLIKRYNINARYLISVHDEVRYLAKEEDKYRTALALQIANAWTRALFCYNLGMDDVPQGVTFFSAVDIDHVLRKEVNMPCITPSHPTEIPSGVSLNIDELLKVVPSLGASTEYDINPDYIPSKPLAPPVTLFPNIESAGHYRFLQAQAERQGTRARWWLDNQRPTVDPDTGRERVAPVKKALGRGKDARVDRMRNATRHLGENPGAAEIREALAVFEEESKRGFRLSPS